MHDVPERAVTLGELRLRELLEPADILAHLGLVAVLELVVIELVEQMRHVARAPASRAMRGFVE